MSNIGEQLRQAREAAGFSLEQVEQATRIRRVFLIALEEERLDALPDPAYARGFVRNYARFVGLDPEPLVEAYGRAVHAPDVEAPLLLNEPLFDRARMGLKSALRTILIILVVAAVAWGGYSYFYLGQVPWPLNQIPALAYLPGPATPTPTPTMAAADPTNTPAPATPTATAEPSPTAEPTMTPEPRTPTALPTNPVEEPTVGGEPTIEAEPTAETGPTTATESVPNVPPAEDLPQPTAFTVRIASSGYTWLEVYQDEQQVFIGYLDEGEEQSWTGEQALELRIGNAGVVSVEVNGIDQGVLGAVDEPVTVRYTGETLP